MIIDVTSHQALNTMKKLSLVMDTIMHSTRIIVNNFNSSINGHAIATTKSVTHSHRKPSNENLKYHIINRPSQCLNVHFDIAAFAQLHGISTLPSSNKLFIYYVHSYELTQANTQTSHKRDNDNSTDSIQKCRDHTSSD